jgi:hypothetical protein
MEPDQSVKDLCQRIFEETGIPMDHQTLVYKRRTLDKGRKLADYSLSQQAGHPSIVHLEVKSRDGGNTLVVKVEGEDGKRLLFSFDPKMYSVLEVTH